LLQLIFEELDLRLLLLDLGLLGPRIIGEISDLLLEVLKLNLGLLVIQIACFGF